MIFLGSIDKHCYQFIIENRYIYIYIRKYVFEIAQEFTISRIIIRNVCY